MEGGRDEKQQVHSANFHHCRCNALWLRVIGCAWKALAGNLPLAACRHLANRRSDKDRIFVCNATKDTAEIRLRLTEEISTFRVDCA